MVKTIIIAVILLVAAGAGYHYYRSTEEVLKRATEQALEKFSATLATKDRAKVKENLEVLLDDTAKIHLEVTFFSLSQMQGGVPQIEDFDKPLFLTFIDNTLYSLQDYRLEPHLHEFKLALDKKSASFSMGAEAWGDSESSYGESHINMRYYANMSCDGHVIFEDKLPRFDAADCKVHMHAEPKEGEEKKIIQSPDALKQLLR